MVKPPEKLTNLCHIKKILLQQNDKILHLFKLTYQLFLVDCDKMHGFLPDPGYLRLSIHRSSQHLASVLHFLFLLSSTCLSADASYSERIQFINISACWTRENNK